MPINGKNSFDQPLRFGVEWDCSVFSQVWTGKRPGVCFMGTPWEIHSLFMSLLQSFIHHKNQNMRYRHGSPGIVSRAQRMDQPRCFARSA
jgi:hypothetical protein